MAKNVEIKNKGPNLDKAGHDIEVDITLLYVQTTNPETGEELDRDCTLEWWEKHDYLYNDGKGWESGGWFDAKEKGEKDKDKKILEFFKPWYNKDRVCPGIVRVKTLKDTPGFEIGGVGPDDRTRFLSIGVVVRNGCNESGMARVVTQFLELKKGAVDWKEATVVVGSLTTARSFDQWKSETSKK